MKNLLLIATFPIILFSCKKDEVNNNTPTESIGDEFVGNWSVSENVTQNFGSFTSNNSFTAPTIKVNDSVFACIQTNRSPDPAWVGSGEFSADTIQFKPIVASRILNYIHQGNIGTYSQNKDTLQFTYSFGGGSFVYIVKQKWVRL